MANAPINTDVPYSWENPGVYFRLNTNGSGSSSSLDKNALLVGYKTSAGTGQPGFPIKVNGTQDAITYAGQGSDACRQFQAYQSEIGTGVSNAYLLLLNEPSGGTAATHLITVAGTATSSGSVEAIICGYSIAIRINSADTATIIGAALAAALNLNLDLPVTAGASSGVVTLTARHKGNTGSDLPVIVNQQDAAGVTFSPGTITYASTVATDGSATVTIGSQTATTAITDTEVNTAVATAVAATINAGSYACTASVSSGVVTLIYVPGRVVNRISAAIVTSTTITATAAVGVVVTDGSTQRPTLTTALSNMAAQGKSFVWASAFNDATSLGTLSTHIESQNNGLNQKNQFLHFGATQSLTVSGAIPAATSPLLTASPLYAGAFCPDSPQQAYEHAARDCAAMLQPDYPPQNMDAWPIHSDGIIPMLLPHPVVALGPQSSDANTAMNSYGLTPHIVTASGTMAICKGRTTYGGSNTDLRDWGVIRHLQFLRIDFSAVGGALVAGKNIRKTGIPHSANVITLDSIKDSLYAEAVRLDGIDLFDGAALFRDAFQFNFNVSVPSRVDGFIPLAIIRGIHQLGLTGSPV